MTDIDFDEIDRAVNSVSNPGGLTAAGTSTSVPVNVKVSTPTDSTPTPSLAERRSSGRFMDVVHPSSDMRTASPQSPDEISEPNFSPDTIDTNQTVDVAAQSDDQGAAPLDSPFLANTKVEKRPLGAFSHEVHESGPATSLTQARSAFNGSTVVDGSRPESTDERPIERDIPLPEELNTDLLSIEANESAAVVTDTPVVAPAVQAVGSTSITQQYAEQPSTGDKPAGAIFNTESYKQPQPKTNKNKKVLFTVLWIFLLVVVGVGIGVALYFFVLQRG